MYGCVLGHCVINTSLVLTHLYTWVNSSSVINLFSCDIKNVNLDMLSRLLKLGMWLSNLLKNTPSYMLNVVRKCISFSTCKGQCGQNRYSLGDIGHLCLPFSIMRL